MLAVPAKLLSVPLETVTSPAAKLLDGSERVKVMLAVWPIPTVPVPVRVTVTDGAEESTVIDPDDTADRFPAPSTEYAL